jgi:hypothetical protein
VNRVACLSLSCDDLPTLLIEDTERERRDALDCIFGEDLGARTEYTPDKLIVRRVWMTREQLDNLPDWNP